MFSIIYYTRVLITRRIRRRTSVARERMIVSNRESSSSSSISFDHQFLLTFSTNSFVLNSMYTLLILFESRCSSMVSSRFLFRFLVNSGGENFDSQNLKLLNCMSNCPHYYQKIHAYLVTSYLQLASLLSVSQPLIFQLGASNVFSIVCLAICLETICIVTLSVVVHRSTHRSPSV